MDEVYYDNGDTFPDENGKSMMLLNSNLNNNLGENWAAADVVFGAGDYGTPGQANYLNDCTESSFCDVNGDGGHNVLDIVSLVNCILTGTCESMCSGDLNSDGVYDVLDVVTLVYCVLDSTCN